MRYAADTDKANISLQGNVSRKPLPNKVESVVGGPHISAATGHNVRTGCGLEKDGAGLTAPAHVALPFEQAKIIGARHAPIIEEQNRQEKTREAASQAQGADCAR
jgi:hypothetical protein